MPKLEPLAVSSSRGGRRARAARVSTSLAEINVVPLVDVMLVLLVIFMVAAPMMQQGFPVRLPESRRSRAASEPVTVTIPLKFHADRRVQIDGVFVPLDVLDERIKQALESHAEKNVILAADSALPYGDVIAVEDQLKAGGVETLVQQTQVPAGR